MPSFDAADYGITIPAGFRRELQEHSDRGHAMTVRPFHPPGWYVSVRCSCGVDIETQMLVRAPGSGRE